ncbi:MAG: hypothetical protein V1743_05210 [Nanoarchaeota archaeon]
MEKEQHTSKGDLVRRVKEYQKSYDSLSNREKATCIILAGGAGLLFGAVGRLEDNVPEKYKVAEYTIVMAGLYGSRFLNMMYRRGSYFTDSHIDQFKDWGNALKYFSIGYGLGSFIRDCTHGR